VCVCTQLDVGYYTAFAVPKEKARRYEFVAISDAVSCSLMCSCISLVSDKLQYPTTSYCC